MTASPTPDLTPTRDEPDFTARKRYIAYLRARASSGLAALIDDCDKEDRAIVVSLASRVAALESRALSREPEAGKAEPLVIGWISVGDRVPDVDAPYHLSEAVIVTDGTYRREARYSTDNDGSGSWSLWSGRFGSHLHPQPTHWMPYPPILALKSEGAPATAAPSPSPQGNDTMAHTPAPPDAARPKLLTISWGPGAFTGEHFRLRAEAERLYALRLERDLAAARERAEKAEAHLNGGTVDGWMRDRWELEERATGLADRAERAESKLAAANARLAELDKLDVLGFQSRMIAAEAEAAKLEKGLAEWVAANNPKALIDAGWVPRSQFDEEKWRAEKAEHEARMSRAKYEEDALARFAYDVFDKMIGGHLDLWSNAKAREMVKSWLAAREGGAK